MGLQRATVFAKIATLKALVMHRRCTVFGLVSFVGSMWERVQTILSRPSLIRMAKHRWEAWDEVEAKDVTSCRLVQLALYGLVDRITSPPFSNATRLRILKVVSIVVLTTFPVVMTLVAIDLGIQRTVLLSGLMIVVFAGVALVGWASAKLLSWTAKTAAVNHCPLGN